MKLLNLLVLISLPLQIMAQEINYTQTDIDIFNKLVEYATPYKSQSPQELITHIATFFIDTPYTPNTLDQNREKEELIINLRETDCILFVEMCLALTQTIKTTTPTFEAYCENIKSMRYRDGMINNYDSRIHYTSEWIKQNEKRGIIKEISDKYGVPLHQEFFFMTTHPNSYPQLRDSDDMVRKIGIIEKRLSSISPFYYIPKGKVCEIAPVIGNGNIICFVSNIEGLDITHVGLSYIYNGQLHFIHASAKDKKVVIEKKTLCEYNKHGIRLITL